MEKNMRRVRRVSIMLLVVLVFLMTATTVFASTVRYTNVNIGNGDYHRFSSYDYDFFEISANTSVNHNITFTETATYNVKSGYCRTNLLGNYIYTNCLAGNNSKYMNGNFTITDAGEYKMFIYNGSANTMTVSTFALTF